MLVTVLYATNEVRREIDFLDDWKRAQYAHQHINTYKAVCMVRLVYPTIMPNDSNEKIADKVFTLTNTRDHVWYSNQEITLLGLTETVKGYRSSCIGDIFIIDGYYMLVDTAGFIELNI